MRRDCCWIGTRGGGVSRWNPRSWELGSRRPGWLGSDTVQAFADAGDGNVWAGSLGGNLTRFDTETGAATSIDELAGRSNVLRHSRVMSLRRDRRGNLWIGTMTDGLKRLTAKAEVQAIDVKPGTSRSTSAGGIMTIVEARDGRMWIGTFGGGAKCSTRRLARSSSCRMRRVARTLQRSRKTRKAMSGSVPMAVG